jgi:hypothetical protein
MFLKELTEQIAPKAIVESFAPPSVANTAYVIGNRAALDRAFNGDIAELIIYNQALTTEQIDSVESYLSAKWGF